MDAIRLFISVFCVSVCVSCSPRFILRRPQYPFKLYKKADWGGLPSTDSHPLTLPVPYVVIHHTYIPPACNTTEQCAASMRSMQTYHNSLGWGDIGYNFCVGSESGVYEGRGWDQLGIHAGPANNFSVGICLIGDWRVNPPPQGQLASTKALIATGVQLGKISPDYKLIGHNQAMSTECPGAALMDEISTWEHYEPGHQDFKKLKPTTASTNIASQTILPIS